MRLILKNTDYAMRALCFMAKDKEKIYSVAELSQELEIPSPFLKKILQKLDEKKIITSHRGRSGGFKMALPPNRIFLVDLIKIFQGPINLNKCFIKQKICPDIRTCALRSIVAKIEDNVKQELESVTIESLLKQEGI
ncbi:MAG: RrF2 family transcriptional regulator [Candidatus Omnitrophota bacterium]